MSSRWEFENDYQYDVMGHVRYQEVIDQIRQQFPKRRQKPVICPVTGEETEAAFGLSLRAWELVKKGLKYEKHLEHGEKQTYYAGPLWAYASSIRREYPGDHKYSTWFRLIEFVAALLGKSAVRKSFAYHTSLGVPRLELDPKKYDELYSIDLTPEQAEMVRRAGTLIEWWVEQAYSEGLNKGSAMLTKMASGELSIDEINKLHAQREGKQ